MNEKEFHSKVEGDFASFLKQRGYPDGSLIYEPAIRGTDGGLYRPDFLVIDPANKESLAIIEVKGQLSNRVKGIKEQLDKYKAALGDITLPAFVVTPSDAYVAEYPFDLFTFNRAGELEKVDFRLFPNFEALSTNKATEKKKEIKAEKKAVTGTFEKLSWWLAGGMVIIMGADFICSRYDITLVTTERLTLLGGAVALVLIPFAQKFKGLGIEWERATSKKDKAD